ncbi:MAG: cyclic nucleotide-binding domain-containing protein [Clostridiales bacterium]|nr:cyclic nucleotide-binding domain-containing protein [Clostridiales bacterium]
MALIEKSFSSGEIIINEGDMGSSFFRILDGRAYVFSNYGKKDQFQLAVLNAGEYVGEMAILEAYPRSATIVASGHTRVVEIPADDMGTYFEENPDQILELMKHLGTRIQAMNRDYNDAQNLLKELRESDQNKNKKSLFSKIKKHMDIYQNNKDKITEPNADALRETLTGTSDDGFGAIESYAQGTVIFNEGDTGNSMYILHIGNVGLYNNYGKSDEVKIAALSDNSFFGEMGMLTDEPRTATAVTESDNTYVEIIYPEDLEKIFLSCPLKITMILRHLSFRLRRLNADFLYSCKEITETYGAK